MPTKPVQKSFLPIPQDATEQSSTEQNSKEKSTERSPKEQPSGGKKRKVTHRPVEELLDPESEESKFLCHLAVIIQQMSPWTFMEETDVFGFQDPKTSELGFVSVMGKLGQHRAIAVYRGVEGLYGWRHFEEALETDANSDEAHEMFFEVPQIQLSFEPSTLLEKRDRAMIKASGFKFSKNLRPQLRSYRPGYFPWFLTPAEASHLIFALTQTIEVAARFFSDAAVLPFNEDPEDRDYLIRVPSMRGSQLHWEDSVFAIDPPPTHLVPFSAEESMLNRLKELSRSGAIEVDLFMLPARVGRRHERPSLLYALLSVEPQSGFILGMEMLQAVDGVDLMFASVAEKLASQWLEYQMVPQVIKTRSSRLHNMLQPFADQLGLSLSLVKKLPALNQAKKSLMTHVQR